MNVLPFTAPIDTTLQVQSPEVLCEKFTAWLDNALAGDKFCYYYGLYVAGKAVGKLAQKAYMAKKIVLYQQRHGKDFAYWAERRGKH